MIKRGHPTAPNFVLVQAGKTVSATVEVSVGYDITVIGQYTVQMDTSIEYYPANGQIKNRDKKDLSSPPVTFQVEKGGAPQLTEGQQARQEEQGRCKCIHTYHLSQWLLHCMCMLHTVSN